MVVFYNMRREAARTLQALSRGYQEDIDDVSYEVIVVENGSDTDQRLGAEFVASLRPRVPLPRPGRRRPPLAGGRAQPRHPGGPRASFALMIDGAHVRHPRCPPLRPRRAGAPTRPAIVATQQWYVGPGQQGDAMDDGYDQDYEDRLFERIRWPNAGYRLFEIGHFVGDRDWFDGLWESNCMFVERPQLEQVGGFDERFSMAGGGYANLELYERLGSSPDVRVATIIGEGSFHQVHGGTTTNQPDRGRTARPGVRLQPALRRPARPGVQGPGQAHPLRRPHAHRGGRRIEAAPAVDRGVRGRRPHASVTVRRRAVPVPDELRWAFTEAVWRTLPWRSTIWLGRAIRTAPTDLLAYQEMVSTVRPDWVVEIGHRRRGPALFLASICELVGHGQVLSIDVEPPTIRRHPRLRLLRGEPPDTGDDRGRFASWSATAGRSWCSARAPTGPRRCSSSTPTRRSSGRVPTSSSPTPSSTATPCGRLRAGSGGGRQADPRPTTASSWPTPDGEVLAHFNPGGYLKRVGP